jgi:hypothetical protein
VRTNGMTTTLPSGNHLFESRSGRRIWSAPVRSSRLMSGEDGILADVHVADEFFPGDDMSNVECVIIHWGSAVYGTRAKRLCTGPVSQN